MGEKKGEMSEKMRNRNKLKLKREQGPDVSLEQVNPYENGKKGTVREKGTQDGKGGGKETS